VPPSKIEIETCGRCGSSKTHGEWKQGSISPVQFLKETTKQDPHIHNPEFKVSSGNHHWQIWISGNIFGKNITEEYTIPLKIQKTVCPRCSMITGGYYEAIIQIRGTNRPVTSEEKKMITQLITKKLSLSSDNKAFLTKIDEKKEGIDYYLGGSHIADSLTRFLKQRFYGKTKKSVTLVGMKDGHNVHRVTYLLRLPLCKKGDIILLNKHIYLVKDIKTKCLVRDLRTGEETPFPHEDINKGDLLDPDIKTALVISESKKEIQVMDPDTYKTLEILKPRGYSGGKQEISIMKWNNRVYLYPPD
jgi:nonsense-mediated mRNA decay protein 3